MKHQQNWYQFPSLTGWWYTYPSEKYESSSVGMIFHSQLFLESHSKFQKFQSVPVTNQIFISQYPSLSACGLIHPSHAQEMKHSPDVAARLLFTQLLDDLGIWAFPWGVPQKCWMVSRDPSINGTMGYPHDLGNPWCTTRLVIMVSSA